MFNRRFPLWEAIQFTSDLSGSSGWTIILWRYFSLQYHKARASSPLEGVYKMKGTTTEMTWAQHGLTGPDVWYKVDAFKNDLIVMQNCSRNLPTNGMDTSIFSIITWNMISIVLRTIPPSSLRTIMTSSTRKLALVTRTRDGTHTYLMAWPVKNPTGMILRQTKTSSQGPKDYMIRIGHWQETVQL